MIGPWAMLDVFLLAVLVSLVKLEQIATVLPAKGGAAFPLHDIPKKEWLEWAPKIRILPEAGAAGGS